MSAGTDASELAAAALIDGAAAGRSPDTRPFEARDRVHRHRDRLALGHALHQTVQTIEATFQRFDRHAIHHATIVADRIEQRFHRVTEIADRRKTGHARAALERMQVALQTGDQFAILRRRAQIRHQAIGMIENIRAFLHEDLEQVFIQFRQFEFAVRLHIVVQRRQVDYGLSGESFGDGRDMWW